MRNNSRNYFRVELCTPSLCTFAFTGTPYQKLCGSNLSSIKQVDIDAELLLDYKEPPLFLLNWLLDLANIRSLTLSASTLQVLSLVPNLLTIKLPSLGNLKALKVKMKPLSFGFGMTLRDAKLQKAVAAAKTRKEAAKLRKAAFKVGFSLSPPLPDGIVDFLLRNSPSVKVDIIDCSR